MIPFAFTLPPITSPEGLALLALLAIAAVVIRFGLDRLSKRFH